MNNILEINGVKYAPLTASVDGLPYVVVRSADSGCHIGYLKDEDGNNLTLVNARRIWYWSGAATLSELAMRGVSNPDGCKFPPEVAEIVVYNCCEKIAATEEARLSVEQVKPWTLHE